MSAHQRLHHQHVKHGAREVHLPYLELREAKPQEAVTVVEIVQVSAENTFTGEVTWMTLGEPVQQPAPSPTPSAESNPSDVLSVTEILAPATTGTSPAQVEPTNQSSVLQDVQKSTARSSATGAAATAAPTATATQDTAPAEGMSTAGKAGLAVGILLLLGTALALALYFLKKKKKQQKKAQQMLADDNEKGSVFGDSAPAPAAGAASIRTGRTLSTAPRLSLRPVTEFSPAFEAQRKSAANNLDVAAGAPGPRPTHLNPNAQPVSAWERRSSEKNRDDDPFSDPVDPFGNHAATNDAVVYSEKGPSSQAPTGPLPLAPTPGSELTGLAAIAPKALSVKSERVDFDGVSEKPLPSPAPSATWTEEIPASAPVAPQPASGREADAAAAAAITAAAAGGAAAAANGPGPGPNNVHRVQMDFKPSMDDELEIRAGQLVRMLHEYDDGWALCIRLDRSQQGVTPRSCLSKHPVKPRQGPPPQNRRPGPPPPGARGPMTPNGGMSPSAPRPLTPNSGRNSPGPQQRGPPMSPAGRPRAASNAHPGQQRSMSPGPYNGLQKPPRPHPDGRRRSNSASQVMARRMSPPGSSPLGNNPSGLPTPARKPVPGQAL